MPISGSTPAPIYLDPDRRWETLGKGIGALGGGLLRDWNVQDALRQSQGMTPEQQVQYLTRRGVDTKFVDQLANLQRVGLEKERVQLEGKRFEAEKARDELTAQLTRLNIQQKALEVEHEPTKLKLDDMATRASIAASNAAASRAGPENLRARADAELALSRKRQLDEESAASSEYRKRLLQQYPPAPTGGGGGGQLAPIPQSGPQGFVPRGETGGGEATLRPIAAGGSEAVAPPPRTASDIPDQAAERPASDIPMRDLLATTRRMETGTFDPTAGAKIPSLSADRLEAMLAALGKPGGMAEAAKLKLESTTPQHRERKMVPNFPGWTYEVGTYDGVEAPIAGSLKDERKELSENSRKAGAGAGQWYFANQALKTISTADPGLNQGSGVVDRWKAMIEREAMNRGYRPFGTPGEQDAKMAYRTYMQHAIVGLGQLQSGMRSTDKLREQTLETLGRYEEDPRMRQIKLDATETVMKLWIYQEVNSAFHNGEQIDPNLMQVYMGLGLGERNVNEQTLRDEAMKKVGIATGDSGIGGGEQQPPPATRGRKAPAPDAGWGELRVAP